ncbi:protein FAM185A [Striga asiatica]|uniref:Protein FAM185A n=1 Tax=Striga asiatica TaxID=4170 RepID=A0A5A7QH40_STRAF|nr:protein FAM185A [Striga asiatica]
MPFKFTKPWTVNVDTRDHDPSQTQISKLRISSSDLSTPDIIIAPRYPQYSTSFILFLLVGMSLGGAGIREEPNFSIEKSKDTIYRDQGNCNLTSNKCRLREQSSVVAYIKDERR